MATHDDTPAFNMLWRELDRALSMPVFSKCEVTLMQVARELSYTASVIDGTRRARPFTYNLARLSERRSVSREELSRALKALMTDHVLTGPRERLKINKRYRDWRGKHQLTPEQVRECDEAIAHPVTDCGEVLLCDGEPESTPAVEDPVQCEENLTPVRIPSLPEIVRESSHTHTPSVRKTSHQNDPSVRESSHSPDSPASTVRKSSQCTPVSVRKTSHECEENLTLGASPLASPLVGREQSNTLSPLPPTGEDEGQNSTSSDPNGVLIESLVSHARGLLQVKKGSVIQDRGDNEDFYPKITGWVNSKYDPNWIRWAIQYAANNARNGGLAQYTNKLLIKWQMQGGPDEIVNATPQGKPRPAEPPAPVFPKHVASPTSSFNKMSRDNFHKPQGV